MFKKEDFIYAYFHDNFEPINLTNVGPDPRCKGNAKSPGACSEPLNLCARLYVNVVLRYNVYTQYQVYGICTMGKVVV